jgi:hypothetical protein
VPWHQYIDQIFSVMQCSTLNWWLVHVQSDWYIRCRLNVFKFLFGN